jgi:hypothetical protein
MHHVPDCTGASCYRPRSGRKLEYTFALANVYDAEDRYAEAERLTQGVVTTYERTRFQDAESVAAARMAVARENSVRGYEGERSGMSSKH